MLVMNKGFLHNFSCGSRYGFDGVGVERHEQVKAEIAVVIIVAKVEVVV